MRHTFQAIKKLIRILNKNQYLGDAAATKQSIFSEREPKSPFTKDVLKLKEMTFKNIELSALKTLPKDTFGYQYFLFLKKHNLTPLNFSSEIHQLFETHPIGTRYVRIHDMVHVLTQFDPDIAGEIGVYSFIKAQNYLPLLNKSATTSQIVGRLLFWNFRKNVDAEKLGHRLGLQAKPLIAIPLEEKLETPLETLRAELDIYL